MLPASQPARRHSASVDDRDHESAQNNAGTALEVEEPPEPHGEHLDLQNGRHIGEMVGQTGALVEQTSTGESVLVMDTVDESDDKFIISTPIKRKITYIKSERPTGELVEQTGTGESELALDTVDESDDEFIFRTPIKRKITATKGEHLTAEPHTKDTHDIPMATQSTQGFLVGMQEEGDSSRDIQKASPYGNLQVIGPAYSLETIQAFLRIAKVCTGGGPLSGPSALPGCC